MKLGDLSVFAILDTSLPMESGLIQNSTEEIIKKYMPEGKITGSDNVFIVKSKKQIILIDAGDGGNLITHMKKIGISPDNVDLVLITHSHFDHVAGLINNGKAVFSKAKILFSEKEKALIEDKAIEALPEEYKPFYLPANQVLKIYGSRVGTFVFGKSVADGIISVDMNGHTAGHSGFLIESKGQKLLIAGDFLHIAAVQFPHPECSLIYDANIELAASMRKQILDRAAKEKLLIAGIHIPFPGMGNVTRGSEGFVFTPVK
jgi:glyoxylase-like metal-dependent hydrolase (beta-lactamase superfamily II)